MARASSGVSNHNSVKQLEGTVMRSMQIEYMDKLDVRKVSPVQQARLGIEVVSSDDRVVLRCMTCGRSWEPELSASGHLTTQAVVCPQQCNL